MSAQPTFLCWQDDPADAVKISAWTHEQAAEEWAERDDYDSAEYSIASGNTTEVFVQREGEPEVRNLSVLGDVSYNYHAKPAS